MFLFQEVRNYIINQRRDLYSTKHTHRSSSTTTTTTTGPWQHHHHHPSLKQDREEKKNTPYNIYGPEGYVHNPPCSLLLFCCVGEESFTCKNGMQMVWVQNGVFKKRRWQKNWD
jgi:hypothetical protein